MIKFSFLKSIALTTMMLLLGISSFWSQVISNYSFVQTSGTYVEITGGTLLGSATVDDNVYQVTGLPFTFNFNGVEYTSFYVSSNGYITFGSQAPSTTSYTPISSIESFAGVVSAWGRDINTLSNVGGRTGTLRWKTIGTAPNREVVIQWKNFRLAYSTSTTIAPYLDFQIRLKESNNNIDIVYGPSGMAAGSPTSTTAYTAQVGLRGPNNTFATNVLNRLNTTGSINSSTAGTTNTSTQRTTLGSFSSNGTPGRHTNGKIYRYSPIPPTCPTLNNPIDVSTGVSLTPTLNWTGGANTANYDVYLSTNQTDVNNQTASARVSTSQIGTSYTSAALSPSTVYYWRIVPKSSLSAQGIGCTTRSFTTAAPSPTISQSGTLSAFSACQNVASTQQSFSVSGLYLTDNLVVTAPTGFSVSTTSGSGWASSVSLTPTSGTVSNTLIYVRLNALSSNPASDNIVCSSTSASSVNVSVSGVVNSTPTVTAGSDFNLCSGQIVSLNGSTDATPSSGTVNSGVVTTSGNDNTNPTATYTFTGLPAAAVINGITVNILSAGGGNCPSWYSVTTILNGVQQGVAGCVTNTTYTNLNGQTANGLVVSVRGQDNDAFSDAMTITYTVTLNYFIPPTYLWSPSTGLSATNVLNPTCSTTSNQTYTLTVTGTNGCSASDQVIATVAGSAPSAPTATVSGSPTINVGGTTILTSTAGANTVWYTTATGGSSIGSGDNFTTPIECTSGSVTYYAEDDNGTCVSNSRGAVSFTVRPVVVSNPSNALICQSGGSVTLSTQLTGASGITWSPNTNLSTTSGSSTVASPTSTTVYTMNVTVTGCGSVSGSQTVGVIDAVSFTPTSSPAAVCVGNTATLASNLASAGFTYTSMPFSPSIAVSPTILCNACGVDDGSADNIPIPFTYNFFGNNYTSVNIGTNGVLQFGSSAGLGQYTYNSGNFPNVAYPANIIAAAAVDLNFTSGTLRVFTDGIAPTRKFVIEYLNVPGFSGGSNTVQIKLCETTGIVEIHVTNASAFGFSANKVVGLQDLTQTIGATAYSNTSTITNTAWKFIPGANYTFQWSTAGSNIGGATSTTYTTPVLSTPGTVSYSVAATNPNTNCTTTQSVNITVNALPAAPVSAGNVTECANGVNQNLVVSVGNGETSDWYAAASAGAVLTSPSNGTATTTYVVPANSTSTYYAEARNTTTGCVSSFRTGVTFTSKPIPTTPTATAVAYCQGASSNPLTSSAPAGANTQNWYTVSTGGTALAGAPTPSTTTAGVTTYYVGETGSNGCESNRTAVTATINASPTAPSTSNPTPFCQNDNATALTATADANNTLVWYTAPTGGTGSSTAITPSTAAAGTVDYYVSQLTVSNCESPRATISVTVNPTITASVTNSASSTSACGGGSITFTATPTNGGSPSYQWYLNGASLSGEVNSTYTLNTPADGDNIYVALTPSSQACLTSMAATNSNTVTLTSSASTPSVSIQTSESTAVCPGTAVTFSVNASSNMGASPSYVWKLNGNTIGGETNATYVSTSLADNDQITLEMTSSLNGLCVTQPSATSSAITTSVNNPTSITIQPQATSVCSSSSASFSVTGAGTGVLTYQWKKNGVNITGNGTATSSTLNLSGVGAGDVADYSVDVNATCGTVSSATAALTLNASTSITAQPTAVVQCTGTTATYSVSGTGNGAISYQWRKDGTNIPNETNATLSVSNITTLNAGQYSVIVTGGCGAVTSNNAQLTVQPATNIATQPTASTICQNNTANFSVSATGQGNLSYQWKLDGNAIGGATSSSIAISNAQLVNAGSYTVDVTGSCGTTASNAAVLTVNPVTSIATQPVGTAGCEGQNTTFTVVAIGTGNLSYQWKYGSTNVGTNAVSFNIPSTTTADDGNYSVVVTGVCGDVTSNTVSLNVYPSPTSIATISTPDITDTTLCGKNEVSISANSAGAESIGQWSVVGVVDITPIDPTSNSTIFTAGNSSLGTGVNQIVWSHIRTTNGNSCYSRDTINVDFKQPLTNGTNVTFTNNCVLWNGLTDTNWSTSSNWYKHTIINGIGKWLRMTTGEPDTLSNVFILSYQNDVCVNTSITPTISNGEISNNLLVEQNAAINLSSGTLTLNGNLTNNGTINPNNGTIIFTGSNTQKITGSGIIANLNNLIIDKVSGTLIIEQPTQITGTLTMIKGNIITDDTNILEIGSGVSNIGSVEWTEGSVLGPIKRWFGSVANTTTSSGIFPIGANLGVKGIVNRYAQVNFTSAPNSGGYIIAEYETGLPGNAYFGLPLNYNSNGEYPQAIQNAEEEGFWNITPYSSSGVAYAALNATPYTLKLRLQNPSTLTTGWTPQNDGNDLYNESTIRLIRSKGSTGHASWELAGTHVSSIETGNGDYYVTSNGITEFSWFNAGGNNQNPLPIELISFTGYCDDAKTIINWKTASEFNSLYYTVEKSIDGEYWRVIKKQNAAGNSTQELSYVCVDEKISNGTYYRLTQIDIDGSMNVYEPILVLCNENESFIKTYPNPSNESFQILVNDKSLIGKATIQLIDMKGKVLSFKEIDVIEGTNLFYLNESVESGIYYLVITNGTVSKVIKQNIK